MWSTLIEQVAPLLAYLSGRLPTADHDGAQVSQQTHTGPYASGGDAWAESYRKAVDMVAKMDLAEKV
jgi:hypothetical protein